MRTKLTAMLITAVIMATGCAAYAPAYAADKIGDINSDGKISAVDIVLLDEYLLCRRMLIEEQLRNCDCTKNGKIDAFDLAVLKKLASEPQTETPVEPEGEVLEEKGLVHSGFATYYDGGYVGGCAMLDPVSKEDYWITAMNIFDYDNALLAGAYLEVTGEHGTINVLVTDLLPEGQKGDLDLYIDAFPLIAPAIKGKVPVTWKIVPLDSAENAPVSYKFKEGSSRYWCAVQVRNHRYPIAKLEYRNKSGEFVELPRRHYNYFESDSMGEGPYTFRITDIYGSVVIDENIPLNPNGIEEGHVQLPK